jgi:hypothetical protein
MSVYSLFAEGGVFCHQPSCHNCFTHRHHLCICGRQNFTLSVLTGDDLPRCGLNTSGQAQQYTGQCSVMFYSICPTNVQYVNNICFLKHCYVFRCVYIIPREFLIVYAEVIKLIKLKYL